MTERRRGPWVVGLVAVAALLAACGGSPQSADPVASAPSTTAPATTATSVPATPTATRTRTPKPKPKPRRTPTPTPTQTPTPSPTPEVAPETSTRIAIAGDTGTGDAAEQATAARMVSESADRPYDALLLLGDLVYEEGEAARTQRVVLDPFAPLLAAGTELVPVIGNHDTYSRQQDQIMRRLGRTSTYYAQQVGNVRILVLDSTRVRDPAQLAWLRARLAEPDPAGGWTIAAMHHPGYSAGVHGSDPAVREVWVPMFRAAGLRLVLAGHDHDYQRSTPQGGVTYVVSGGGAKLRDTGRASFTAVSRSVRHYVDLVAYPDRLELRAIDQRGGLVDAFTITR